MTPPLTRREFLKVAGMGAAAAVLTGCGPTSRYVTRQPYAQMPEYTVPGKSTYFATTCGECAAGCGLIVRTVEGRAHKIEGNPAHPVNHGNTCARGQAALQGLYNPDRITGPAKADSRGSGQFQPLTWEAAIETVRSALNAPRQAAFILGGSPDHLADLVQQVAAQAGLGAVVRCDPPAVYDGRVALMDAAQLLLGAGQIPYFDLANADVVLSFGANFAESWLSPVHYSWAFGHFRQGRLGRRGLLIQLEPRLSQTAAAADQWIPLLPGSEALVAQTIGGLLGAEGFPRADLETVSKASGVKVETLQRLADLLREAEHPLILPGGSVLGQPQGVAAAQAILALNLALGNAGQPGGVWSTPAAAVNAALVNRPATLAEMSALIARMNAGEIKTLFVHRANPLYSLPKALGFAAALQNVPQVISFASFLDETAMQADYLLPDHTPLESWGYQKNAGADRALISTFQPVVVPVHDTRATVDVLLAALGGSVGAGDEVTFVQQTLAGLAGGESQAAFWVETLQHGGVWPAAPGLQAPGGAAAAAQPAAPQTAASPVDDGGGEYPLFFWPYPHALLGDGSGANLPMLQETPDPMTTVMWNSWVEINPQTARELGVRSDQVVKVTSPYGEIEAVVYEYPGLPPQVIAMPLGQGHTAYGRYAAGRGVNPLDLLGDVQNEAGDLAFAAVRVKITPTGKHRSLARYESRIGVYGEAQSES